MLGLREFRDAISDKIASQLLVQGILLHYRVLWMGHSVTDPDLQFLLDQLVGVYGVPPRQHVALIKTADVQPLRAETFLENYGIRIETYDASPDHREVLELVKTLEQGLDARAASFRVKLRQELEREMGRVPVTPAVEPVHLASTGSAPVPPGRYSEPTLADYCRTHLEEAVWNGLSEWYESLRGDTERELLRINVDRECHREDMSPQIWQEFLRRLAAKQPAPVEPLATLKEIVDHDPGLFGLKGRRIDGSLPLYRYMPHDAFMRLFEGRTGGGDDTALENKLLGVPGRPVWCSNAFYA